MDGKNISRTAEEEGELEEGEIGDENIEKESSLNRLETVVYSSGRKNGSLETFKGRSHYRLKKRSFQVHSIRKLPQHRKYESSLPVVKSAVQSKFSNRNPSSLQYSRRVSLLRTPRQNHYGVHPFKNYNIAKKSFHYADKRVVGKSTDNVKRQSTDFPRETRKSYQTTRRSNFSEDDSYENLLRQYRRIQFQLEDLRKKEKNDRDSKDVNTFHSAEKATSEKENHYQKHSNKERRWRRPSKGTDHHLKSTDKVTQQSSRKHKISKDSSSLQKKKRVEKEDSLLICNEHSVVKKEEDEDELELRRKALASRNKCTSVKTVPEGMFSNHALSEKVLVVSPAPSLPAPLLSLPPPPPSPPPPPPPPPPSPPQSPSFIQSLPSLSLKIDSFRDNYELVDMELDSDIELTSSKDEFKLSYDSSSLNSKDGLLTSLCEDSDDEELDAEVLRAQLLISLAKRNSHNTEAIEKLNTKVEVTHDESKIDCVELKLDSLKPYTGELKLNCIETKSNCDETISNCNEIPPCNGSVPESDKITPHSDGVTQDCEEVIPICSEIKQVCSITLDCTVSKLTCKEEILNCGINNFSEREDKTQSDYKLNIDSDTEIQNKSLLVDVTTNSDNGDHENFVCISDVTPPIPSRTSSPLELPHKQTLVINLKDDSSSDESEINSELPESRKEVDDMNVPAGLELLLKEARMKADMKNNTSKSISGTPAAVYRLSKAQQLEYRKLKEMIARKESNFISSKKESNYILQHTNAQHQRMKFALPCLEAKLSIANATLQKEKQLEQMLRIQHNKKKAALRRAQLRVNQLREQLRVAEKVVLESLQVIQKTNLQLRTVQASVDKRSNLVLNLEHECQKLGFRVYGSAYQISHNSLLLRKFPVKCIQ